MGWGGHPPHPRFRIFRKDGGVTVNSAVETGALRTLNYELKTQDISMLEAHRDGEGGSEKTGSGSTQKYAIVSTRPMA